MTWSADPTLLKDLGGDDERVAVVRCRGTESIRHGSWFHLSNITLIEIILIMYHILRHNPAHQIENEPGLSDHDTVAGWGMFCRETTLEFLEGSSDEIGGPNKTVEIDDSKIGESTHGSGPVRTCWES